MATGAIAVASDDGGERLVATDEGPISELQDGQRNNFVVLREPAELGASLAESSDRSQVGNPELWGQSRLLARPIQTPTGTGWVIPGRDTICLAMPDKVDGFGVSCAPTSTAVRHGLPLIMASTLEEPGTLAMLLPDQGEVKIEGRSIRPDADGLVFASVHPSDVVTVVTSVGGDSEFSLPKVLGSK